jgi:hypothetical protein
MRVTTTAGIIFGAAVATGMAVHYNKGLRADLHQTQHALEEMQGKSAETDAMITSIHRDFGRTARHALEALSAVDAVQKLQPSIRISYDEAGAIVSDGTRTCKAPIGENVTCAPTQTATFQRRP